MKNVNVTAREFECRRGELTIRGIEYRGEGERLPIAVVSHGFLANYFTTRGYARRLAEWGYAAYCFDFCGGCVAGYSDGRTEDMTVLTEVEDLLAVIGFARTVQGNDPGRVTLMGCSQGGLVSALAAAKLGREAERLVLFYPALCIPDDARAGKMMFYSFDPSDPPERITGEPITLGRLYPLTVRDMDVMKEISRYTGPVLIVHGDSDGIVAPRYAVDAVEAYNSTAPRRCQLVMIEGAAHGFDRRADGIALDAVRLFLEGFGMVLEVNVELSERQGFSWTPVERTRILPFTGRTETPWFRGAVLPGAKDVQTRRVCRGHHFRAEYDISGTDYTGEACRIHVVNENTGGGWEPTLLTDSTALNFLNTADAATAVEPRKKGPMVRIFVKTE